MRDPKLVVLDEPLEGVDKESERSVLENIKRFVEDKTLIIVSHRFSMLSLAEKFATLEDGRITFVGELKDGKSFSLLRKFIEAERDMTKEFLED